MIENSNNEGPMSRENEDLVVDIDMPSDIALAFDDDGMPKTVPGDVEVVKAKEADDEPKTEKEAEKPDTRDADIVELQRERDAERLARQRLTADANAKIEAERRARAEAESDRDKHRDQTLRAHWAKVNAENDHVESVLAAQKAEIANLKSQMKSANENAQFDVAADLQERLATAAFQAAQLEQAKRGTAAEVERAREAFRAPPPQQAKKEVVEEPVVEEPKPTRQPTPDEWISQFPRKTQSWLKENKDYVTDPDKHKKLIEFANEWAQDYGQNTLHTPPFIEALAAKFNPPKPKKAEQEKPMSGKEAEVDVTESPVKKGASLPSAPVSRSSPAQPSGSGAMGKVRLSADEQNTAAMMYPNMDRQSALKKYAANKLRATADGMYAPR